MERAADLLVEQDVAREAVDLVVQAEGHLAEDARALVHVEQRLQIVVAGGRLGVHDAATLETQPDVLHPTPSEDCGKRETNLASGLRLDRAREDLAVRHVELAVRCQPAPAVDAETQVRVGAHDAKLADRVELPYPCVQLGRDGTPVRHRILVRPYVAGAVDEVLVLCERHLGVLRVGVARKPRPDPVCLAGVDPLPEAVRQLAPRGDPAADALRVRLRQ